MAEDTVAARLVKQRVRNRLIEYLTLASSFDKQREYQTSAPTISVPNDVINQWEDWASEQHLVRFGPPVFTSDEGAALAIFGRTLEQVAHGTHAELPSLEETLRLPQWERLRAAAEVALNVFERRGKLPEDESI